MSLFSDKGPDDVWPIYLFNKFFETIRRLRSGNKESGQDENGTDQNAE